MDRQISMEEFEKAAKKEKEKKSKDRTASFDREPPISAVGLDTDQDGQIDTAVVWTDVNQDAVPDVMQRDVVMVQEEEPKPEPKPEPKTVATGTRTLLVTIHAAYNLLGRNVGLMRYTGGLSRSPDFDMEPYVVAKIGGHKPHRTPPAIMFSDSNRQNPVWNAENNPTFYLEPLEHLLELEVFASKAPGADKTSYGKVCIDINGLKSGQWQKRREKLILDDLSNSRVDPASPELEFDIRLELLDFERAIKKGEGVDDMVVSQASDFKLQFEAVKGHMRAQKKADVEAKAHAVLEIQELASEQTEVDAQLVEITPLVQQQEQERDAIYSRLKDVEAQILTMKSQLDATHGQRRSLNLDNQKLLGARSHFSGRRRFLEGIVKLEQRLLEAMKGVTGELTKSNNDVQTDTDVLKQQQSALRQQAKWEQEKLQEEVRRHSEVANKLDRMRRETAMAEAELKEANVREGYVRQMQSDTKTNTWSPVVAGGVGAKPTTGWPGPGSPTRIAFAMSPTAAVSFGSSPDV